MRGHSDGLTVLRIDPMAHPEQLKPDNYMGSFGEFIFHLAERLELK
jgi:hypothetical protein